MSFLGNLIWLIFGGFFVAVNSFAQGQCRGNANIALVGNMHIALVKKATCDFAALDSTLLKSVANFAALNWLRHATL